MVQLKIILDTRRKKSDGTYPIMFRVTNSKQVNYLSFGLSIIEQEWDEKNKCISGILQFLQIPLNFLNSLGEIPKCQSIISLVMLNYHLF